MGLVGSAVNAGSTLERFITNWDKQNADCTWKEEDGWEVTGTWNAAGASAGYLQLFDDGSYVIDVRADRTDAEGVNAPDPEVAHQTWQTITDLSESCVGEGWDTSSTRAPMIVWASDHVGARDVDGSDTGIRGQLDPGDPGSILQGTLTWEMAFPEGLTITVDWHLEHDGPITLPR